MTSEKSLPIYWTAGLSHTVSPQAFGQAQWLPESSKMNFPLRIIRLMSLAFFMNWNSPSSVPKRNWQKLMSLINRAGVGTSIPALKKSQERRGGDPLRGRSQLPARPYPLSDMGADRFSARNPYHGTEKYAQDFWYDRTVLRQVSLSFSESVQCRNIYRVS